MVSLHKTGFFPQNCKYKSQQLILQRKLPNLIHQLGSFLLPHLGEKKHEAAVQP
jgi:hypothetical protein